MKVPDNKEVANHAVPESCAVLREEYGEALTGVRVGQPLSHEICVQFWMPCRYCGRRQYVRGR